MLQDTAERRKFGAFIQAVSALAILVFGYFAFINLSGSTNDWTFRLDGGYTSSEGQEDRPGSQYLLGVGKADITG
jgi:hypothetical protein